MQWAPANSSMIYRRSMRRSSRGLWLTVKQVC
jgi:hypothetical protein